MRGAAHDQRASPWATAGAFGRLSPVADATRSAPRTRRAQTTVGSLRALAVCSGALATCAVLLVGSPAHANEMDGLRDLNLQVYGRLEQHCAIGKIDDAELGDLTRPGIRAESRVALDCNVPINVKITAANGALANDHYPLGQGPYAGSVLYSLEVRIPVRHPWHEIMTRRFESRALAGGGQTFNTGDGIAVDGVKLKVALQPTTSPAGLLAGRYSETIEITVTPS
jgi:hypothetical protein